eukprot:CAMPEP_0194035926 /NCGR_PEP_ID=MMETSP0009_2-20130614/8333_1 /TAXON_ID=210454 /ORGANISM="Grammatophora oceanica, Strain CCMP 410" /LENGTH=260 /DNA_ID=CAMNT_0038677489 /DNA_START=196 /DNA_END=978 /DNA_ORIENTATION=+
MKRSLQLQSFGLLLVAVLLLLCGCSIPTTTAKKARDVPHPHQGLLKPHEPGPFASLSLKAKDEATLAKGNSVMKQDEISKKGSDGGGAICVQDVQAPTDAVWNQILRMDDYKGKVGKVLECKNYFVKKNKDGSITMKTKQRLGILPGYSYENYYDHTYYPEKGSLVWRMDYEKNSDFDDVAGHWHIAQHPSNPEWTRVYYACDIKMRVSPPGPILNFISKSALKQATAWVKKESEKAPTNQIPTGFESKNAKKQAKPASE